MSVPTTADLVIIESKVGTRIHKATCKRVPDGATPLQKTLEFAPGIAAAAKPAGCCKPQLDEVLAEARAAAAAAPVAVSPQRRHFTPDLADPEPAPAPKAAPATAVLTSVTYRYPHAAWAWESLVLPGVAAVAEVGQRRGTPAENASEVVLDKAARTVTFTGVNAAPDYRLLDAAVEAAWGYLAQEKKTPEAKEYRRLNQHHARYRSYLTKAVRNAAFEQDVL